MQPGSARAEGEHRARTGTRCEDTSDEPWKTGGGAHVICHLKMLLQGLDLFHARWRGHPGCCRSGTVLIPPRAHPARSAKMRGSSALGLDAVE